MKEIRMPHVLSAVLFLALLSGYGFTAEKPARETLEHDLTKGDKPDEGKHNHVDFNVGPTGFRGWVAHWELDRNGKKYLSEDSSASRQVLVTKIDPKSPADGQLEEGDVILGADGRGAIPRPFTSDARKSIANAITDAEERNPAILKLLRWRKGKTDVATLVLETLGAYSVSAPYDCEKSRKILEKGVAQFYKADNPGNWNLGLLVLLAANDPRNPANEMYQSKAREWAHGLIASDQEIAELKSGVRPTIPHSTVWRQIHSMVALGEYYLATSDEAVFPTFEALAICVARNQSGFGTIGHCYAAKNPDGSDNGPIGAYGAVNGASMPGFLGLVLAQKAGVKHPSIQPAIERAARFFSYYAGKGTIPYGEGPPWTRAYDLNGKNATAALTYALLPEREKETKYFARMTMNSWPERQLGHGGPFFQYVWPPLGSAAAGKKSANHYFTQSRWMYELSRRWDGKMEWHSFGCRNAWSRYRDQAGELTTLLTYALPLRQLHITGRGHDPKRWLSDDEFSNARVNPLDLSKHDRDQLLDAMGSWSPLVREKAAAALVEQAEDPQALLPMLHDMASDGARSPEERQAACHALRLIKDPSSAEVLLGLLTDKAPCIRTHAAHALRYLPNEVRRQHLDAILKIAAANVEPVFPLNEEDPLQLAQGALSMLLFYGGNANGPRGILDKGIDGVDRKLLFPAMRALAETAHGGSRSCVRYVYPFLSRDEVLELGDMILEAARVQAPADSMFSGSIRIGGTQTFLKHRIVEALPMAIAYATSLQAGAQKGFGWLKEYGDACLKVQTNPPLLSLLYEQYYGSWNIPDIDEALMNAIFSAPGSSPLIPLKKIHSVTAGAPEVKLPARSTMLRVKATNYGRRAEQDTIYTWRKLDGPGKVDFEPNGTWGSKNTEVSFVDREPGRYRFSVTMSDVLGYTTVSEEVVVTLLPPSGRLPANKGPEAQAQSITAIPGVPVTVVLSGRDPESRLLSYHITRDPRHGTVSGDGSRVTYTPEFGFSGTDSFTFTVVDSHGEKDSAKITINASKEPAGVTVYEPFDYPAGPLDKRSGATEVGFAAEWSVPNGPGNGATVTDGSFHMPCMPAKGNRISGWIDGRRKPATRKLDMVALQRDGLLSDGKELWMSVVASCTKQTNFTNAGFSMGLSSKDGDAVANAGLKAERTKWHSVQLNGEVRKPILQSPVEQYWTKGQPCAYVLHCRWGKTAADPDTVTAYRVFERPDGVLHLLEKPLATATGLVDQSKLDTLYFQYKERIILDEIRIGPTYLSVLRGTEANK